MIDGSAPSRSTSSSSPSSPSRSQAAARTGASVTPAATGVTASLFDDPPQPAAPPEVLEPGAVVLRLDSRDDARAFLSVASDGTPITAEVERYLFEPFFSTRSRGTGLGLYICRELCERYGASIDYRARAAGDPHPNEFFMVMRRMPLADTEARLHLTS